MWKEENEFRKRIRPIHIQIIFSWLDFPIFFLLPFRKLKLDQNPIIGKKNRNWNTSKCPLVWLSWKSTTPFRPRLQSNLQKYERRSEGHNINVISDIPTLQQFLDIVANFLFPLFPLENIKKKKKIGGTLSDTYMLFSSQKSLPYSHAQPNEFSRVSVQRSEVDLLQCKLSLHFTEVYVLQISHYVLATKIHPNCIRNAQNRKSQIVKSYLSYIEPSPQFLPEHKSFLFRIWLFLLTSPVTTTTIVALLRSPLAFYTWEAGFVQLLMVVDVQVKKSSILRLSLSPFSCSNS